jgi:transposase
MSTMGASGKPQSRRYTPEEKAQAVRMVFALREELGTSQGTVRRVADQLGYGVESVRGWVKQAEIDAGETPGATSAEQERIRQLEQENRELKRANAILKSSAAFFAAELDRPQR